MCEPLYEGNDCGTQQSLLFSYVSGFIFFALVLCCLVPWIFFSGFLGGIAKRLRHVLGHKINEYKLSTHEAWKREQIDEEEARKRKEELAANQTYVYKACKFFLLLVVFSAIAAFVFFVVFLGHGLKMAFNVYLILSSFVTVRDWVNLQHKMNLIGEKIDDVAQWIDPDLAWVERLWDEVTSAFDKIWNIFGDINLVDGIDVTCYGAQSPLYLALNYFFIALVVVMFDSNFYVFLRVSITDYKLKGDPTKDKSLKTRQNVIKGFMYGCERGFKSIIQIMLSSVALTQFVPYYNNISEICEDKSGGLDSKLAYLSSAVFWGFLPITLHLLINTFVMGLAPVSWLQSIDDWDVARQMSSRDLKTEFDDEALQAAANAAWRDVGCDVNGLPIVAKTPRSLRGGISRGSSQPVEVELVETPKVNPIESGRRILTFPEESPTLSVSLELGSPVHEGDQARDEAFGAPAIAAAKQDGTDAPEDGEDRMTVVGPKGGRASQAYANTEDSEDLIEYDPRFWQQPFRVYDFFVHDLSNGNVVVGFLKYSMAMFWKTRMLLKLTLGIWDEETVQNMQVKERALRFDVNTDDEDTKHESMLVALGESHSLIWQFLPLCVIIAKGGEALNFAPVFIRDSSIVMHTKLWLRKVKWFGYVGQYVLMSALCLYATHSTAGGWFLVSIPVVVIESSEVMGDPHIPKPDWDFGAQLWADFTAWLGPRFATCVAKTRALGRVCVGGVGNVQGSAESASAVAVGSVGAAGAAATSTDAPPVVSGAAPGNNGAMPALAVADGQAPQASL